MKTSFGSLYLWYNTGCIVGTKFLITHTARPGADGIVCCFKGNSFEASRIVWSYGRSNHIQKGGPRRTNSESALSTDHRWADIEGVAAGATKSKCQHGCKSISDVIPSTDAGMKRSSMDANFEIRLIIWSGPKLGSAIRAEDPLSRAMFLSGLNNLI